MIPRKPESPGTSNAQENTKKRQRVESPSDENRAARENRLMAAPAPKRPKRKVDGAYNPRQRRTSKSPVTNWGTNFCGRAEMSQQISPPHHSILAPVPSRSLKTSILLDHSLFSSESDSGAESASDNEMVRRLKERFKSIESYRPIKQIIARSPKGTPSKVRVAGDEPHDDEILEASSVVGFGVVFSNNPNLHPVSLKPIKKVCSDNPVLQSSALTKVKPAAGKSKIQETTITHESLKQTRRENRAHSGRALSQNRAVAAPYVKESEASASKYAGFVEISRERASWEWLHLIAHQILGEKSQTESNLVAGTNHANTEMLIMIEQHIKLISDAYPDGFELRTEAQLMGKNLQISNNILYTITTPDFCLPFNFNAQTENKPHTDYGKYFEILIKQLIEHAKTRKLASNVASSSNATVGAAVPPPPSKTPSIEPPFFTRKPIPTAPKKSATSSIITPTKKHEVDRLAKRGERKKIEIQHAAPDMAAAPSKFLPLAQVLNEASTSPSLFSSRASTPSGSTDEGPISRPETPSSHFLRRL